MGDAEGRVESGERDPAAPLVVTWGGSLACAMAGWLLGWSGLRVVRVEPPGEPSATDLRRRPPLLADGTSAWHRHLCRHAVPADAATVLAGPPPDVVLVDDGSPAQDWPDGTVVVRVSSFGPGPYEGWRSSELALWALGGYLAFTGAPDREPLWLSGGQAGLHAGAQAAFAALAALHGRDHGVAGHGGGAGLAAGGGQHVVVSELASVLAAHVWLVSSWASCGQVLGRVPQDLIRAADGLCYVMRISPNDNLFVLIDRPDLAAEDLAGDVVRWNQNLERIFTAVAEWAATRTVAEIVELGQLLRVAVTPVRTTADLAVDEQLDARRWWQRDGATDLRLPGPPARIVPADHTGADPDRTDTDVDRTGTDVRARPAGGDGERRRPLPGATGPLQGVRVVEVTNNWAGPLAGRMLADLGADVIKVEWASRPATRVLFWAGPYQDREPSGHERSLYFSELNRNKRDVVLDLSDPVGRDTFLRLIADADVFIENMSARVMPNLGLDWPVLQSVNPRLVMLSMSGYGATGPHRDWVAYGANIETTSGLTSVTGYRDGVLSRTTLFYADPISGLLGATAILGALRRRDRRGRGEWIDLSLNEAGALFVAGALLEEAATGRTPGPCGNDDERFAPHGVYRCAGTDSWVAIAAQDDGDWLRLAEAAGLAELAADPSLRTLEGRLARRRQLDERLSAWTAGLGQYDVARRLQAVGVSAAPVLANWQILTDPHIHASGFYQPVSHPEVGVNPTSSWPWAFGATPATIRRHAPLFGQDNRQVLGELGLSEAEIDALYATGVTADQPQVG
ncbi:MAG: CoA transferase [Acidimicrobiales bacterium]|nr:CoA transferase [Acidimicrobiales bacterium]